MYILNQIFLKWNFWTKNEGFEQCEENRGGGSYQIFLDFFEILAVGAAIRNSPIKRPNGYEKRGRRHLKRSEGLG